MIHSRNERCILKERPNGSIFMNRVMCLTSLLLCLFFLEAHAAPCGIYVEQKTGSRIEFDEEGMARAYEKNNLLNTLSYHFQTGATIKAHNAENTQEEEYILSDRGRQLTLQDKTWGDKLFLAKMPYRCEPKPKLQYLSKPACEYGKEAECCIAGDTRSCVRDADAKKAIPALRQYCSERPDACLELVKHYEADANPSKSLFDLYAEKKALPIEQVQELVGACEKHRSPELCRQAVIQLWRAHQFELSRDLLKKMCDAKLDGEACARFDVLKRMNFAKATEQTSALPCGQYKAATSSLVSSLHFLDKGVIETDLGSRLRARFEQGLIKVRHDKGGDFVFAKQGDDTLLGMDSYSQLTVYNRVQPPSKTCQAPVIYAERALSTACGLDKDPAQCCKEGDSQGCNRLGNMSALKGQWKAAAVSYALVCRQGIRVGCENWIYTISQTGDGDGVEKAFTQLCKQDDLHVACDLLEQNKIQEKMLLFTMGQALKESVGKGATQ